MVRRRHNRDIGFLFLQKFPVVFVSFRLRAGKFFDLSSGGVQLILIDVGHRRDSAFARLYCRAQDVHPPPACPDECDPVLVSRLGTEDGDRGESHARGNGSFNEVSAIGFHRLLGHVTLGPSLWL